MFNFFASIADLISTAVTFIIDMVTTLITVITRSVQALAYVVVVLAYLPGYLGVYVLAMVSVSVILFIINKGSD